jgi:hypothetical protein
MGRSRGRSDKGASGQNTCGRESSENLGHENLHLLLLRFRRARRVEAGSATKFDGANLAIAHTATVTAITEVTIPTSH